MSEETSFFEKLNNWFRNSISFKIFSIAFLVLILMIPTSMVEDLIRERQYRQEKAIQEINNKWGGAQTVTGPVLTIPYYKVTQSSDNQIVKQIQYAHFLPEQLDIKGEMSPVVRHRGIYESVLYSTGIEISGQFKRPDFSMWKVAAEHILWDEAMIGIGISDLRGVNEQVRLKVSDSLLTMRPGIAPKALFQSGISARLDSITLTENEKIPFKGNLSLNGSATLQFHPIGEETSVNITSNWPNPSFSGYFLPDTHDIQESGFIADWKILQLNRNFPQQWINNQNKLSGTEFGLELLIGVDQYQQNERSAKYAFLIIALSFLLFFFIEVINKRRIHPIQYLLVGFALILFYALLLAISEKTSFSEAYLISSFAIIGLISWYVHAIFKTIKFTALLTGSLVLLYGFVYVILQLEDYSLLVGTVGLFLILATVMMVTRKINWYQITK